MVPAQTDRLKPNGPRISLRAKLRLYNDKMLRAREDKNLTVRQVAEQAGVRIEDVYRLQRLDFSRTTEEQAISVAVVLGLLSDDVMPPDVCGKRFETVHERTLEVPIASLLELDRARHILPDPGDAAADAETQQILRERMSALLRTLTYREREILKLRFGIGDNEGNTYTLEEISRIFRVPVARVHNIQAKAIRKLQHPMRMRRLEQFVEVSR